MIRSDRLSKSCWQRIGPKQHALVYHRLPVHIEPPNDHHKTSPCAAYAGISS